MKKQRAGRNNTLISDRKTNHFLSFDTNFQTAATLRSKNKKVLTTEQKFVVCSMLLAINPHKAPLIASNKTMISRDPYRCVV
jgi:hypothetical protein